MDEYIDRNTAIAKVTALEVIEPLSTMVDVRRLLADMPAADVAPVVHATCKVNGIAYLCTHCHKSIVIEQCDDDCEMNYCPNCGAKWIWRDDDGIMD